MESTKVYLASLATFKFFYDKDMDIYSIISEFIKDTLYKSKESLELEKVKKYLYDNYNFDIPLSVIKTALNKLIQSSNVERLENKYSLISADDIRRFSEIEISNNDFSLTHQKIIESIMSFITKIDSSYNVVKEDLVNDFFKYITNSYEDTKYKKYIAMFLANDNDSSKVKDLIQQIKDGEILLTGLSYQQDPNEIEIYKLRKNLTIYIDQELLFSSIGYNGELYKEIFNDFLILVNGINNIRNNKGKVLLRYFSETKKDIENYFYAAENIVTRSEIDKIRSVKNNAMRNILTGAIEKSDIVSKKSNFFKFLREKNILEDDSETFESIINKNNYQFNIYTDEMKDRFLLRGNEENDFSNYTRILSMINLIRKGKSSGSLENVGAIFLTAKSALLNLSWDPDVHEKDMDVPLVTTIDFMINRFWFKTQKNITNFKPRSFDIALQAKLIVNSIINNNFTHLFDRLKNDLNNNKKSENDIKLELIALRNISERVSSCSAYEDFTLFNDDILEIEINKIKSNEKRLEYLENINNELSVVKSELLSLEKENNQLKNDDKDKIIISKSKLKKGIFYILRMAIIVLIIFLIYLCNGYIKNMYDTYSSFFNIVGIILTFIGVFFEKPKSFLVKLFKP
jgi:hypothetical protein